MMLFRIFVIYGDDTTYYSKFDSTSDYGSILNWLQNLIMTYKARAELGNGLLISIIEKVSLFHLVVQTSL